MQHIQRSIMNKMHVLVTGGTGFLGAALVRRLVREGHCVRVLDNGFRSAQTALADLLQEVELIQGDIRDCSAVSNALKGIDSVIHLAAVNGTEFFYTKPALVLEVGVRGMLNVLEGAIQHGIANVFLASSSEVYQYPEKIPTDETVPLIVPDPLNPRYSYGGSKIISELLLFNYGRLHFQRAVVFRPHNVYGPAMGKEHVVPQFIARIVEGIAKYPTGPIPFSIQGNGKQTRSFIYIEDMIDGIMLLIEKGKHFNIYHVGNPEEITIASLADKVANHFDRELKLEPSPLLGGSTERRCPNIDKIKELGFQPKISLNEGLPPTIEWYTHLCNNYQF